jgi:hypothetical protein
MTTTQNTQITVAQQAYQLRTKLVYPNSEFDYEAWIVEFPGWRETDTGFWEPQTINICGIEGVLVREQGLDSKWHLTQFNLPEHIEFETIGDIIHHTDYPECKPNWPIMSKRMLDTLLSVREFPHQTIPITMIDCEIVHKPELGRNEKSGEEVHDFVAVQLLEHLDIFDWENSVYELEPNCTDRIESLDKLVLRVPEGGLPPLFRVKEMKTYLCVSSEGRTALEAADIRGVDFLNLVY